MAFAQRSCELCRAMGHTLRQCPDTERKTDIIQNIVQLMADHQASGQFPRTILQDYPLVWLKVMHLSLTGRMGKTKGGILASLEEHVRQHGIPPMPPAFVENGSTDNVPHGVETATTENVHEAYNTDSQPAPQRDFNTPQTFVVSLVSSIETWSPNDDTDPLQITFDEAGTSPQDNSLRESDGTIAATPLRRSFRVRRAATFLMPTMETRLPIPSRLRPIQRASPDPIVVRCRQRDPTATLGNDPCCICLEHGKFIQAGCGHAFCSCLTKYVALKYVERELATCPECRAQIKALGIYNVPVFLALKSVSVRLPFFRFAS